MAADLAQYVRDLGIILGTAAATGLVSQALRQPPVLGDLIAGMLVGPHVPGIVLGGAESHDMTQGLSEFGVISRVRRSEAIGLEKRPPAKLRTFITGTEPIIEVLAKQSLEGGGDATVQASLEEVQTPLPGFPDMTPVRLSVDSAAVGFILAQLDLRVRTGATVLALSRGGGAADVLRPDDILTLTGSEDALATARALLYAGPAADPTPSESRDL